MKKKVLFCWSGGKDSALALYRILNNPEFEVVSLLTTVNREYQRISMHGVREDLLNLQAERIGLPVEKVYLEKNSSNDEYEKRMEEILVKYKKIGVEQVVFGDIFLEDLKKYREDNLAKVGLKGVFPLWKEDTKKLVKEFTDLGFKTILCCVHNDYLDDSFAGKVITGSFTSELPENVDPCGENGEFHTFVFEGPIFKKGMMIKTGERIKRTYEVKKEDGIEVKSFCFVDILPV